MALHNETGKWGEQVACDTLVAAGYAIVETNWRSRPYELDIIAMKGGRIVFVEVKTRKNPDDDPFEAVNARKVNSLVRAANAYILSHNYPHEPQFDIIGISGTPDDYTVEHIPDAFFPPIKSFR